MINPIAVLFVVSSEHAAETAAKQEKFIKYISMKAIHIISAVVGGAIAGAALGLLVAPEKGEDTRKKILKLLKEKGLNLKKSELEQLADEIEEQIEK